VDKLAKYLNIDYTTIRMPEMSDLSNSLLTNESPQDLGSMQMQYSLCKQLAGKHRVIITGDGADELFGGYRRRQHYRSFREDMKELSYYHLPRLDKMFARFTMEHRAPFLSQYVYAWLLNRGIEDSGKQEIKKIAKQALPSAILNRAKHPLKSPVFRNGDPRLYRWKLISKFTELWTENELRN
jgi:asparagine synthetase B (glutamine-hydrolysing)